MPFFKKKRFTELDDVSIMTESEKEKAIISLENRRYAINEELEGIMKSYARLTKKRRVGKRKYKMGKAPNDYRPTDFTAEK